MADTRNLPLLRWGEALRAGQKLRGQARRRTLAAWAIGLLAGANLGSVIAPPRPVLMWNLTRSTPVGLYRISDAGRVRAGDIVVAWAPDDARRLGAERRYLPINVPLIKSVAATHGDTVCAIGETIFINARPMAQRLRLDRVGRPLPWWSGCVRLVQGDVFLLSAGVPDAFDGRYFGITTTEHIVGRARLLWEA